MNPGNSNEDTFDTKADLEVYISENDKKSLEIVNKSGNIKHF